MTREKSTSPSKSPRSVPSQRLHLAPEANRANTALDAVDAQLSWQRHIDTGLLTVR